ncbi:hypothetical protein NOC27_1144 [Nitrosococcus oceani AFC27]|nr:hypothetical protein NOC27_1144 [Nitrosococcus oceani AFC27]
MEVLAKPEIQICIRDLTIPEFTVFTKKFSTDNPLLQGQVLSPRR